MDVSGTQTIDTPIKQVWSYLLNVHNVAACAPGFQSLEEFGAGTLESRDVRRRRPGKATFTLDVTRPEMQEPERMVVKGRGKAPGSAVELSGTMHLSALDSERTSMEWHAHVVLSGTIASVGARLMHSTAEKMTAQFFDCLKTNLQGASHSRSAGD